MTDIIETVPKPPDNRHEIRKMFVMSGTKIYGSKKKLHKYFKDIITLILSEDCGVSVASSWAAKGTSSTGVGSFEGVVTFYFI